MTEGYARHHSNDPLPTLRVRPTSSGDLYLCEVRNGGDLVTIYSGDYFQAHEVFRRLSTWLDEQVEQAMRRGANKIPADS